MDLTRGRWYVVWTLRDGPWCRWYVTTLGTLVTFPNLCSHSTIMMRSSFVAFSLVRSRQIQLLLPMGVSRPEVHFRDAVPKLRSSI